MNEKIKELRKLLNLSLVAFSKPLGCSPTHIKRMEVGTVIPGEEFISKLCEVYHISPAYFEGKVSIEELDIKDKEEEKKEIGKRLKQARKEKGMTLKELSLLASITDSQLSLTENGHYRLKENRAEDIAEALEVGVEWLLYGEERNKNFPADRKMMEWLKNHEEVREKIWEMMTKEDC